MELGPFFLISLFYVALGLRVVYQLVTAWRQTWDLNFTMADRALVTQAAFFVLMPLGVALHELGHAATIKLYGGTIAGWGFYGFAGFVSFYPAQFDDSQRIVIAAAGTLVNIGLAAAALAFVFLRRPPARAAINELLIQFVFISLLNALIVYPLLDITTGMNGDWSQIYFGGVPSLSGVILAIHVGLLALLFWAWRGEPMRRRFAALTGAPTTRRVRLNGRAPRPRGTGGNGSSEATPLLDEVAERVSGGWPVPVAATVQGRLDGQLLLLTWTSDEVERGLAVLARPAGDAELRGIARWPGAAPDVRALSRVPAPLSADALTMAARMGMEAVERWRPVPAAAPSGSGSGSA